MTTVEDLRATTILFANKDGLLEEHVDRLIAAARAEGAEKERERILSGHTTEEETLLLYQSFYKSVFGEVPASVLTPKEKK